MELAHAGDGASRFLLLRDVGARPHPAGQNIGVVERSHLPFDRTTAALTQPIPAWDRFRRTPRHKHVGLMKRRSGSTQRIIEGGVLKVEHDAKTVIDQHHLTAHPFDQDRDRPSTLESKRVN